jgi:hypothetical protein
MRTNREKQFPRNRRGWSILLQAVHGASRRMPLRFKKWNRWSREQREAFARPVAPPRRTGLADFPHPALLQAFIVADSDSISPIHFLFFFSRNRLRQAGMYGTNRFSLAAGTLRSTGVTLLPRYYDSL